MYNILHSFLNVKILIQFKYYIYDYGLCIQIYKSRIHKFIYFLWFQDTHVHLTSHMNFDENFDIISKSTLILWNRKVLLRIKFFCSLLMICVTFISS